MLGAGRRATRLALALGLLSTSRSAWPSEPDATELARAHDAYARGAAAYSHGDYARAARDFAAADALVPDAVTLRVALEAATLADDAVLGTELVLRSERGAVDGPLAHAVSVANARFAHRTGRIIIRCDACLGMVDGAPAEPGMARVVSVGVHVVVLQANGAPPEERMLTVAADETKDVRAAAKTPAPPSPATVAEVRQKLAPTEGPSGVSPVWFAAAGTATAALLAITIGSWVDTANDHSAFSAAGCQRVDMPACSGLQSIGQAAEARTLWLGAGTGVAALGTAALGVFVVRWHAQRERAVSVRFDGARAWMHIAF